MNNTTEHKKHRMLIALLLAVMVAFAFGLTGCGEEEELSDDDIDYMLNEGADQPTTVDKKKASEARELNKNIDNFIGTWEATSEEAKNLYGHLKITINDNGTFDADVTDEKFSGTWTKIDGGISYTSELMSGKIYYGETCRMIIEDSGVRVTMRKVE
ncbi:MAG: hypothetical protein IJI20_01920 [Firmicutes bacterium]|nr:hypothetical protein [Bacillota bacterium]